MTSSKTNKSVAFCLLVVLVMLLFSGCSGEKSAIEHAKNSATDEELIERNKAYLSEYPDGAYAGEALMQIESAEIRLAGKGLAFPEAAAFDQHKGQPYKVFIIKIEEYLPGEIFIRKHEWNEFLPVDWAADTLHTASLYCILKDGDPIRAGSQLYHGGGSLIGIILTTDIEVREARTGNTLFSAQIKGSIPVFPYSIQSSMYQRTISGNPADYYVFEEWLFKTLK